MKRTFSSLTLLTIVWAATVGGFSQTNPPIPGIGLPVTYDRLLHAGSDAEIGNWLMYTGTYDGFHFSKLDEINTSNVQNLHLKWLYQMRVTHKVETTPVVADGIMYITRPPSDVVAIDAATGRRLWTFEYGVPAKVAPCCGQVNRGLSIIGDRLFLTTIDAHVVALDAKTGRLIWKTEMADYTQGYTATAAPIVAKDKVIVGMAGGEKGVRGFLDAYYISTGERAWRFYTTAGPDDPKANSTWPGDSWKRGGATTWTTGTFDPALNLVYWGTGNPGPDYDGEPRAGDNLYSCSMLALDLDTGKLKWHFQFTPHDLHDWDSTQTPILLDTTFRGQPRKLLLDANRNGFFYVLDRVTGEYLLAKAYMDQTWAKEIDSKGRPVLNPGQEPTPEGNIVAPGLNGGNNYMSPSYSPLTRLFYAMVRIEKRKYFKDEVEYKPGENFTAGGPGGNFPPEESWGKVAAIVPETAEIQWEHRLLSASWGGILSTAGNLVFAGSAEGNFFALDARTGKELWHFQGSDSVHASPVSYVSNGKQQITVAIGDILATFGLD
jgi:alcohol dehydrogenase (cytochrome c)